jgi:hypothetical protein
LPEENMSLDSAQHGPAIWRWELPEKVAAIIA